MWKDQGGLGVADGAGGQVSREFPECTPPKVGGGGQGLGRRCCIGSLSQGLALHGGVGPPLEQQCKAREEERWGGCAARALTFPRPATLQDSIKKFEQELMLERHMTLMKEKQVIVRRQQEEVSRLMQTQVGDLHHQVGKQIHDRWAEATARKGALGLMGRAGGLRHLWPWVRQVTTSCIFQSQALFSVLSYFSGPARMWSAVIRTVSPSFTGKTVLLGPLPGVLLLLRAHWVPGRLGPRPLSG